MSLHDNEPQAWALTDVALVVKKSDLDPDSVTRILGLDPSGTCQPGVNRWNPGGETDGEWRFQIDERTSRVFSEQLDIILTVAEGKREEISSLAVAGCDVHLAVYGYAGHGSTLALSDGELGRLSALNIPLEITPNINER
ncbi:DUF4279 domain-containing protein [Streptomyces sp. H10-C2]|uniref:DUF4279 domain-containing protein n=1 Tax=unclassified Streptomyces TaxID=2593676 RepID=UPI0024BBC12F|nr:MULTISPECIES: DUF4279 domain-containing protein [unclassified Streptomyces]MDJ0341186.1 DUF4279 domain-containing protein [Streptomyces sp. PH10-H1]MDJ0369461.1 DUF4279 domain-containing protein [Streptomyces sp. H10-C2]